MFRIIRSASFSSSAVYREEEQCTAIIHGYFRRTKKGSETVTAEGYQTPEGFLVLKGSHISPEDDDTIFPAIRARRKEIKVDSNWVLQEDILCRSPSFAAMLVIGKHASGPTSWKTADGRTLKSLENK